MGLAHSPRIVTDGLVLCLDSANVKAYFGSWSPALSNGANAFDGDLSTVAGALSGNFGPYTYTIANSPKIISARMYVNLGATSQQVGSTTNVIKADGTDVTQKAKDANAYANTGSKWIDVTSEVGDTWSTFQITGTGGSTNPNIAAIEINGKIIVGNYSGTTWTDLSTNGNNGTISGATHTSGADGYFSFDGSNDTVNFEYDLRSNWTYECWVNKDSKDGFDFLGQGVTSSRSGLHIIMYNDRLRFGMYGNDTDAVGLYSNTSTGVWYHYAFTYNHSTFLKEIYRNGVQLTGTPVQTQTSYIGTGTVRIGGSYSSGGSVADGKISSATLYNRVLTAAEVAQNFNALRGRYGI